MKKSLYTEEQIIGIPDAVCYQIATKFFNRLPVGQWAGRGGPARSISILGIVFYSRAKRELISEASNFRAASEHFKLICHELVQFGALKMTCLGLDG